MFRAALALPLLVLAPALGVAQQSITLTQSATTQQATADPPQAAPTPPARDPQAVALAQAALTALGGSNARLASISASGTYTSYLAGSTVSYPLRVEALGSDKFRWEIDTADQGTIITVVNGTVSWTQSPANGTQPIPVGEIPGKTFETFPALAFSTWVNSATVGLQLIGVETVAGASLNHFSITPVLDGNSDPKREKIYETTHQREVFLDVKTNLPVRMRYYSHPLDWRVPMPVEVEYSNFQSVGGIAFPSIISSYHRGRQLSQIQYLSIVVNVPIAASDFLPAGVTQ